MESLLIIWRLLVMISIFAFPQLIGVLLYFRLVRISRWLAVAVGLLTPAILFFYLAPIFFFAGLREAQARREVSCGMPALGAALVVFTGTAIELIAALPIHSYLFSRRRPR